MVSTRRTAHIEPAVDMPASDISNTLRKKPVRKPTAKKAEAEPKPKTTRGRKAAAVVEEPAQDEVTEEPEITSPVKPTRRGAGRPKKAAAPAEVIDEPETQSRATKPTRATAAKSKNTQVMQDAQLEETQRDDRPATRRTRATGPAAQPLSPKKITQVSKPQTRNARSAIQKPSATKAASTTKGTIKARGATRKCTVSDENAETSEVQAPPADGDVVVLLSTPVKHSSPVKSPAKSPAKQHAESEASMSSCATTPTASPEPTFHHMHDENEYRRTAEDDIVSISDADEEVLDPNEASEDELCGPKTPMRRPSPGAQARYLASVQRTVQRTAESPMVRTPVGAVAKHRRVLGTPKTQVPCNKPAVPTSAGRAMTIALGNDRSLVSKDLSRDAALSESVISSPSAGEAIEDLGEAEAAERSDDYSRASTPSIELDVHTEADVEDSDDHNAQAAEENEDYSRASTPSSELDIDVHTDGTDLVDASSCQAGDNLQSETDPDATIIISDEDSPQEPEHTLPTESFDTDDTVLITHDVDDNHSVAGSAQHDDTLLSLAPPSPTPETIIWENIRQDVTIPIDFDNHLAGAELESTSVEGCEMASPDLAAEVDAVAGAEPDTEDESELSDLSSDEDAHQDTVDLSVDLNDFIDLGALAEPTQALELTGTQSHGGDELPDTPKNAVATQSAAVQAETASSPADDTMMHYLDNDAESNDAEIDTDEARSELVAAQPAGEVDVSGAQQREEDDISEAVLEGDDDVPHYALPTISFDARRKSLPAFSFQTPVKAGTRPSTSDGASAPRMLQPFLEAHGTIVRRSFVEDHAAGGSTESIREDQNGVSTPVATPKERYPRLTPRNAYEEHANTVAQPSRFRTPTKAQASRPATARKPAQDSVTPRTSSLRPRPARPATVMESPQAATSTAADEEPPAASTTPVQTPSERFPRLKPRSDYEEHAQTVAAPRFQTPAKTPVKRPSTVQKPGSLRKVALKNSTPMASRTPVKTPLKPPAMTPGQAPMTPHPAAPLRGVTAMVEIYTLEGASASAPFVALLHRLGAKTTKVWSERVTHVVFKDGSPTTLQRVRLHNKGVDESSSGAKIHCVNSRWVSDCDTEGTHVDESDEAYTIDVAEIPRGGGRRRKSMEPSALINLGGNIIRNRKSSFGRSSLSRSPLKFDSPAKQEAEISVVMTPKADDAEKENKGEEEPSSPATPVYLAAPDKLVQQTAPINHRRKLGTKTLEAAKNRRLTFFNGAA